MSVPGVSEVASVGGFVQEYQVDVDPDRMRYHNVSLADVVNAVRRANVDVTCYSEFLIRSILYHSCFRLPRYTFFHRLTGGINLTF